MGRARFLRLAAPMWPAPNYSLLFCLADQDQLETHFAESSYAEHGISDRTKAGMEAARKRGVKIGRPSALTDDQIAQARELVRIQGLSYAELAVLFKVSKQTIARVV